MADQTDNNNVIDDDDDVGDEDAEDPTQEEEDEEPKLKYQRLGSHVVEILRRDAASCMAVHDKFLCLGTHWGFVFVLDFNGNEIKRFSRHSATINELSIDDTGEFIASCSDDGKVCINALYTSEAFEYEHHRPVISVALDPLFSRKATRSFAEGGRAGQLVINSKGWFGRKDNVLHSGEGPIHSIKWKGSLIAWANDIGVKIFDCDRGQRITYIDRPKGSPRPDLYRCHLCWENENTLLIGWADSIKIGQIKERGETASGHPDRYVEIIALFQTDYFISGIAPFGEYLVVLAFIEETEDDDSGDSLTSSAPKTIAQRPELMIITRTNEEISSDALTIHGYENYKANDYRLGHMEYDSLFYVVSPRDIVVARPRDLDDHISWLMDKKRYEEALRAAEANEAQLREHKLTEIGEKYLEYLLGQGETPKAAELLPKILKRDAKLWEQWIYRFAATHQLRAIVDYIPVNPVLNDTVYEMVLCHFLSSNDPQDHKRFLGLVELWRSNLYQIKNVINALNQRIQEKSDDYLMDALAKLYTFDKQFDKTLEIYLRLKRGNAFDLIKEHDLFDSVRDKVALLMKYDAGKATSLLINHLDRIPIEQVVDQLKSEPKLLHLYLHTLFIKDPQAGRDFHELQVTLYADYDYKLLLPFLRQSNYYPLEKAYKACADRNLYKEMVFIMGRMGNTKQGLQLLIEKIGDVREAIEFIESQNDQDLWEDLIDYSMKNPKFVSALLEEIGAHVDPIRLIKRIPEGMQIDHLRDRLVKIISDYNLQMSLREGCKEVLKADCVDLEERLYRGKRRGLKVEEDMRCAICAANVITSKSQTGIIVFFCRHLYHSKCLRSGNQENKDNDAPKQEGEEREKLWCTICQSLKKTRGKGNVPSRRFQ
eukprot:TRINITY_DN5998_c0_g1_i1.p1 TRINITY_DN5998_c0_g1~~TRINITY_DN5998_c0_g1_i1.p1  ORF type:complete len:882 (+),score=254.78 TRINITY_DN5998_c0_g1_i1:60-2705(+)